MCGIATAVNRILEHSTDVSRRLAEVEEHTARSSRYAASTHPTLANVEIRSARSRRPRSFVIDDRQPSSTSFAQFDPLTESQLFHSKIYSRVRRRFSTVSFTSNTRSGPGMSFLSAISLGQLSTISLISLPVSCHELWNPQYYDVSQKHAAIPMGLTVARHTRRVSTSDIGKDTISHTPAAVHEVAYFATTNTLNEQNAMKEDFKARPKMLPDVNDSTAEHISDNNLDECWAKYEEYWRESWDYEGIILSKEHSEQTSEPVQVLLLGM